MQHCHPPLLGAVLRNEPEAAVARSAPLEAQEKQHGEDPQPARSERLPDSEEERGEGEVRPFA